MSADESAVREIIQQGYGDGSMDPLARASATKILERLRQMGWATPEEVAYLVEAAGGEIIVTEELVTREAPMLSRQIDEMDYTIVFRTHRKEEC